MRGWDDVKDGGTLINDLNLEDDNADVFCVDKQGAEMEWQVALDANVINSIVRKFYE